MQYLGGSKHITQTIEANEHLKWWVDCSYTVHPDMQSHSSVYKTLGKGATYSGSFKQKLNMKSSMEAELVVIDDGTNPVDQAFPGRPSTLHTNNNCVPGQQEYHLVS